MINCIIKEYARDAYAKANCKYGGNDYFYHIDMVEVVMNKYSKVFKDYNDLYNTIGAIYTHDLIEDAKQTYNDIKLMGGKNVADITLAVTDVHAENRLMRHLLTMHKTVADYRAIILKMCDIYANGTFSEKSGSGMYDKYKTEYQYRRPIFKEALKWYESSLNQDVLNEFWDDLDSLFEYNMK